MLQDNHFGSKVVEKALKTFVVLRKQHQYFGLLRNYTKPEVLFSSSCTALWQATKEDAPVQAAMSPYGNTKTN